MSYGGEAPSDLFGTLIFEIPNLNNISENEEIENIEPEIEEVSPAEETPAPIEAAPEPPANNAPVIDNAPSTE